MSDDHKDRRFFYAQISESKGGEPMPDLATASETQTSYQEYHQSWERGGFTVKA